MIYISLQTFFQEIRHSRIEIFIEKSVVVVGGGISTNICVTASPCSLSALQVSIDGGQLTSLPLARFSAHRL
jgi:hypothetical protein